MGINRGFLTVLLLIFFNSGGLMLPILATLFFNDLKFNVEVIAPYLSDLEICYGLAWTAVQHKRWFKQVSRGTYRVCDPKLNLPDFSSK